MISNKLVSNVVAQPAVGPVFFYSDTCPLCGPALMSIAEIFIEAGVALYVRKPEMSELMMPGFAFPALWIPAGCFGSDKSVLFVGAKIPEALSALVGANS